MSDKTLSIKKEKLSNDDFIMIHIGRGKWNDWHSVGFAIETREQTIQEYEHVMISCRRIRCKECHEHAISFIAETSDYVWNFLTNHELTDSEIIDLYNRWLYDFHCVANINAKKDANNFPTYEEVADYYLNFEVCTSGCSGHS